MWESETVTYVSSWNTAVLPNHLTTILEHISELSFSYVQEMQKPRNIKNNHKFS